MGAFSPLPFFHADDAYALRLPTPPLSPPARQPEYDFYYDEEWQYNDYKCEFAPSSKLWSKAKDIIKVTLSAETTTSKTFTATSTITDATQCQTMW